MFLAETPVPADDLRSVPSPDAPGLRSPDGVIRADARANYEDVLQHHRHRLPRGGDHLQPGGGTHHRSVGET